MVNVFAAFLLIFPASDTASRNLDFYSLTAKDIQGNEISLEQYKRKVRRAEHNILMLESSLPRVL